LSKSADEREKEEFLTTLLKEVRESNTAAFIGAGLSKAAGYVDWPGLMQPVAASLGLDMEKEVDLVAMAQYYLNASGGNRHDLNQLLIEEFSDLKEPTENHMLLARLPIQTYWTTNYDRLIEKALESGGRRVDAKYTNKQLATTRRGRDAVVYKMHGDIEHPSEAVLSKDDYERYHETHEPFITALSGDLVEKTFLFLGFSFTDPNLDFVLSRIRVRFSHDQRRHYCIMRRRTRRNDESKRDFEYALNKQNLVTQDLLRFNIKAVFVDEFSDVTRLLQTIVDRYRRRTIFISGSAADYGEWGREGTEEFVSRLARELIDRDLRITSGFGLGIGAAVVTGAVQQIYSSRQRSLDAQLVLRPFPIGIGDTEQRRKTFVRYREELVAQAGIAIFIMGNKLVDGKIVLADGMRAEFELARSKGVYIIPAGASGSMATELWNEVTGQMKTLFPQNFAKVRPLLQAIGKTSKSPNDLIKPILELVDLLSTE
jgi:Sir2- and TIR-associating SLOG family/SIR2-like domain